MLNNLCVIPARSGSKGVPGKNKKILGNKPLLAHSIDVAKESCCFSEIVVSTDSEDIAMIAEQYGASIPFLRPSELATDSSPTIDTVHHLLSYYRDRKLFFDTICLLQPTSPFRTKSDILSAYKIYNETKADSLISISKVPHQYNPYWVFEESDNDSNYLTLSKGNDQIITRRQELPNAYFRNGSIYITDAKYLLRKKSFYGKRLAYYEMNAVNQVNIDTMEDWLKAEELIKIWSSK